MALSDCSQNLASVLTDYNKYLVLKRHFEFPKSTQHNCLRSCRMNYLSDSFVYSQTEDGVYCLYCALFVDSSKRSGLSAFVNKRHILWHNILEKEERHTSNQYHEDAKHVAIGLTERFEKPKNTITVQTNSQLAQCYDQYPSLPRCIATTVHLMLHSEVNMKIFLPSSKQKIQEYFLAILREIGHYFPPLTDHMFQPTRKNATYLSAQIQNEMIEVIAKHIIQRGIIEDVKEAGFHSISADEVTDQMMKFYQCVFVLLTKNGVFWSSLP